MYRVDVRLSPATLVRHALLNRHPRVSAKTRVSTGGDDSVAGDNLTSTRYKECLALVCKMFGFKIKESDYRETTDLSECGFLGGLARQVNGRYVYTPKDPQKMYDSMFLEKQELAADEEFNKILSLTALIVVFHVYLVHLVEVLGVPVECGQ